MPLFMDVHPGVKVTLQELKAMHLADLEVQEKYGVKYHRFWLNEESETVFCLMHGPNKQACMAVHEEAHGGLPCNIIEVLPGEYEFFLGQSKLHDEDRAHLTEEVPDTGFRIFIHIDTLCPSSDAYSRVRSIIGEALSTFNGREIEHLGEGIRCVFTSSLLAVEFAIAVQKALVRSAVEKSEKGGVPIELRMGICASNPVTDSSDKFFGGVLNSASSLSNVAKCGQILISSKVKAHFLKESTNSGSLQRLKVLDYSDEKFLTALTDVTNQKLGEDGFNVYKLSRAMGISRPQLYRKLTSLTGQSPKDFIREKRLKKAFKLIQQNFGNISEIALEVGFNNPSYFSRYFQKRFGFLPSAYAEIAKLH